jgi:hypothetical protein
MDVPVPGSGDCEAHIEQWGQPVLLLTSASYILAGLFVVWIARRNGGPVPRALVWSYAAGLVLAGLGSMDYHGPSVGPQPLLHDGGLAIALVAALAIDLTVLQVGRIRVLVVLLVAAVAVIALVPAVSPALAGVAAVGLVVAEVSVYRRGLRPASPALWAALANLSIGAAAFSLSRTAGPLCDPGSWFQGHGVWHVLTAAALGLWAVTALQPSDTGDRHSVLQGVMDASGGAPRR